MGHATVLYDGVVYDPTNGNEIDLSNKNNSRLKV